MFRPHSAVSFAPTSGPLGAGPAPGVAPEAHGKDQASRQRHAPPSGRPEPGHPVGHPEARRHPGGYAPVVPHHEPVPEAGTAPDPGCHLDTLTGATGTPGDPLGAPGRRTSTRHPPNRAIKGTRARRAASAPGQLAPAPSAPQKVPNELSMTPTTNLSVFSGTRASGARAAAPAAATTTTAARAATAASGRSRAVVPKVTVTKATSSPSNSTPLKASEKAYQSLTAATRLVRALLAPSTSEAKISSSSWGALRPAALKMALRSHWSPKASSRAPTTSLRPRSGSADRAGPR